MRCEDALQRVVERARVEADSGAPGHMVAIYVDLEVRHFLADHDGSAGDCTPCHNAMADARR